MEDEEELNYLWYYRTDEKPLSYKSQDIEWKLYENSDLIENAYQDYLFSKENSCENISDYEKYLFSGYVIDFVFNVQYKEQGKQDERLIGRFNGNPYTSQNTLSSSKPRWFFSDQNSNNKFPVWAPYRIYDNDMIEQAYRNYKLSKGSSYYENDRIKIDFLKKVEVSKSDGNQILMISRFLECPTKITRIDYYNNQVKPQKSSTLTINDDTLKYIKKDYFIKIKNIFPINPLIKCKINQFTRFFYKKDYPIIMFLESGWYDDTERFNTSSTTNGIINELEKDGYEIICEINREINTGIIEIKKGKFQSNLLNKIFKTNWYVKLRESNNYLWKQYDDNINDEMEKYFKQNFLKYGEKDINITENLKIDFYKNIEIQNNISSPIIRFNVKNKLPDKFSDIIVPEEISLILRNYNMEKKKDNQEVLYSNKFGPKSFKSLIDEIDLELKNEGILLNLEEEYNSYKSNYFDFVCNENFPSIIIKIYTEEGFVYRRINKILRDQQYDEFLNMKYYYISLLYSLNICKNFKSINIKKIYRGLSMRQEQREFYDSLNEGQMILFNEFLSTTYDENIALKYANSGSGKSCIIKIDINNDEKINLSTIEDYSRFKHEKEVLLPSGSILSFKKMLEEDKIMTLHFELIPSNNTAFLNYIVNYKKEFLNLKTVLFDNNGIEKIAEGLRKNALINEICLKFDDTISIRYLVKKLINNENSLIKIELTQSGEIKNNQALFYVNNKTKSIFFNNFSSDIYNECFKTFLENNKDLSYLFPYNINAESLKYLGRFIETQSSIKALHLNLIKETFLDQSLIRLSNGILKSNCLKELILVDSTIDDNGVIYLAHLIKLTTSLKRLKLGVLSRNNVDEIAKSLYFNDSLSILEIEINSNSTNEKSIFMLLQTDRYLDIYLTCFSQFDFRRFLTGLLLNNDKILSLNLSDNKIDDFDSKLIADYIRFNKNLKLLNLSNNKLKDEGSIKILQSIKYNNSVEKIVLENNKLSEVFMKYLKNESFNPILKLYFDFNLIESQNNPKLNIFKKLNKNYRNSISHKVKDQENSILCLLILENGKVATGGKDKTIKIYDSKDHYKYIFTLKEHNGPINFMINFNGNIVSCSEDKTIRIWDHEMNFKNTITLSEHEDNVNSLTVINNKKFASCSSDGIIIIWENFKCIISINGHDSYITSIIITSEKKLITGSTDKIIKIWNISDPDNNKKPKTLKDHDGSISCLISLLDGKFASGSSDKTIKIWDTKTSRCLFTLSEHENTISCMAVLSNGYLVSGSQDKTIKVWDPRMKFNCILNIKMKRSILSIISLNKNKIIIGVSRSFKIWNLFETNDRYEFEDSIEENENESCLIWNNKKKYQIIEIKKYNRIENSIHSKRKREKVVFSEDDIFCLLILKNGKILSGNGDRTIKVWDPKFNYKCVKVIKDHDSAVTSLIQRDDCKIISGSLDFDIKIWDEKLELLKTINYISEIFSLLKLNDKKFASISNNNIIIIWDDLKPYVQFKEHKKKINCMVLVGHETLASGSDDMNILIWSFTGKLINVLHILRGHRASVSSLVIFEEKMYSASLDGSLLIWDSKNNFELLNKVEKTSPINSLIILNDGKIVSGHEDKSLIIWENNSKNELKNIQKLDGHGNRVICLASFSNGSIISGAGDKLIKIWDPHYHYRCVQSLNEKDSFSYSFLFLQKEVLITASNNVIKFWRLEEDESFSNVQSSTEHVGSIRFLYKLNYWAFASCSDDKTVKIWEKINNYFECTITLKEHEGPVYTIITQENGNLITGSFDRTIKIWDKHDKLKCIKTLKEHEDSILSLIILKCGRIVSGSEDKMIKVWDPYSGYTCQKTIKGHDKGVTCLALLLDGKVVSGSNDKTVKIWDSKDHFVCIISLKHHNDKIMSLFVLKDGRIVSGSSDKSLIIWDPLNNYQINQELKAHKESVTSIALMEDGSLATGSIDKTIIKWKKYTF